MDTIALRDTERARLREMREAAGFSGRALAAQIGVTHTTVQNIEGGHVRTTMGIVRAWCAACGRGLTEVFDTLTREHYEALLASMDESDLWLVAQLIEVLPVMGESQRRTLAYLLQAHANENGMTLASLEERRASSTEDDERTSPA